MPFETASWAIISTTPTDSDPRNTVYSPDLDIIVVGAQGPSGLLTFGHGHLLRSVDHGETWSVGWQSNQEGDHGGAVGYFPAMVGVLRNLQTGEESFAAIIARITQTPVPIEIRLYLYTSPSGAAWTRRQDLVQSTTPAVSFAVSTFASRRTGLGETEHLVFVSASDVGATVVDRGLFVSQDGVSWSERSDPGTFGRALVTHADQVSLLNSGIEGLAARSEDGGHTWQLASGGFGEGGAQSSDLITFGGGPCVLMRQGTLGAAQFTRISCDDGRSWPLGQNGPSVGLGNTAVTGRPQLLRLSDSTWECLMAAADNPLGVTTVVYSKNGGETAHSSATLDSGSGILQFPGGLIRLRDGRPVLITFTHHVFRSSDVAAEDFGARIYCVLAPAPGVGIAGFPEPCGDFYNPCPQECPTDPASIEGLVVAIPAPVVLGDSWPYGDEELTYGDPEAIYGGEPNAFFTFPVLGLPAGCGATFVNEPCASAACPA